MMPPRRRPPSQRELLAWGQQQLKREGRGPHEARTLLQWALQTDSLLQAPDPVGQRAAGRYRSAITQRCRGFPLQHIVGEMHFRRLTLQAGPGVFAVRPETEMLVDLVGDLRAAADSDVTVADLCAGSGAIGLSVATEFPRTKVSAVELSPVAAAYAQRNYDRHRAHLAPHSTFEVLVEDATTALPGREGTLDIVVSNPPYVPGTPPLQGDVLYDPEMALYGGGEDGLVIPRGVVVRAEQLLTKGGWLLLEHGDHQGAALRKIAADAGFRDVGTVQDLTGRDRFLRAHK